MKKIDSGKSFLIATLFVVGIFLIVGIFFVAISPFMKKGEVGDKKNTARESFLKTQLVLDPSHPLIGIDDNFSKTFSSGDTSLVVPVSFGFTETTTSISVIGLGVVVDGSGKSYVKEVRPKDGSGWVIDFKGAKGADYFYGLIEQNLKNGGDIAKAITSTSQASNFIVFDMNIEAINTYLNQNNSEVIVPFKLEVVYDSSPALSEVVSSEIKITRITSSAQVAINDFKIRGVRSASAGVGEVGDTMVLTWNVSGDFDHLVVLNQDNNNESLNLGSKAGEVVVSNFEVASRLVWKTDSKNDFLFKVCGDSSCGNVLASKNYYVNTTDCSDKISDNAGDEAFSINDITAIQNTLLVDGNGTAQATGPRRDLNNNGLFEIADLVSAAQCYNCIWNWKGCSE